MTQLLSMQVGRHELQPGEGVDCGKEGAGGSLGNVDPEIFHDALKVLSQQILFHHHQKTQGHLMSTLKNVQTYYV